MTKRELTETDKAYFAGIIDGEGSISCSLDKGKYSLFVAVGMKHERVPKLLYKTFGGGLSLDKSSRQWHWAIHGRRSKPILEATKPYVKEKVEQVKLALAFIQFIGTSGVSTNLSSREHVLKEKIAERLRELNKTKTGQSR